MFSKLVAFGKWKEGIEDKMGGKKKQEKAAKNQGCWTITAATVACYPITAKYKSY